MLMAIARTSFWCGVTNRSPRQSGLFIVGLCNDFSYLDMFCGGGLYKIQTANWNSGQFMQDWHC
jgi:hypothetical protein